MKVSLLLYYLFLLLEKGTRHMKHKSCLYRNTEINRIKYHINLFGLNDDLIYIMKNPKYFAVTVLVMPIPILGANDKDKEHTFFISILIIVLIKKAPKDFQQITFILVLYDWVKCCGTKCENRMENNLLVAISKGIEASD